MRFVLRGLSVDFHIAIKLACLLLLASAAGLNAQTATVQSTRDDEVQKLKALVLQLQSRVEKLEEERLQAGGVPSDGTSAHPSGEPVAAQQTVSEHDVSASSGGQSVSSEDRALLDYLRGTTINFAIDAYYGYNFNHPVGRVNALRAYDVLSNNISLNQANVIFERAPDLQVGRRYGARLDLQFGQATDTLQGNPANEPRPQIYRNILQAYGTYILPVGNGISLDVGKWSSSLGFENNYTKDQMNYSRSFFFDFLPFYHMGVRAAYKLNDRVALNYWLVNGTNQAEATNGFKDELFGFTITPNKNVAWTANYYLGQEQPDRAPVEPNGPIPVQPGLSFAPIKPAPDGRTHIFDSYVTWQATPKLSLALEGDYVIQRLWEFAAPGHSAQPSEVWGGAAYARYQLSPKFALATRAEYLADHGGLFSGITQALKENTLTLDYKLGEGFLVRSEYRRDFSNRPSFFTDVEGQLKKEQNTATLGLLWWFGRKQGTW
jgi:Putative beta-barrel porin-2, OmpL-like. bbp2